LQALAVEIEDAGGRALPISTDLTQLDRIENMVSTVVSEFGQIDVLFNNAGFGRMKWLEQLDPQRDIELQIQTNLTGLIQTTRTVLPWMIERRSGQIINMSSIAGWVGTPTYSIYAATKFAVRGFTEALRREVGVWGIHVTGIYPGGVATEFSQHTGVKRKTGISTPAFLRLSSDDVARAIWRVVKHPRRSVVMPWPMGAVVWFNTHFPRLVDGVMERRFTKQERGQ
jgi:short-subunit dehydrogenase